VFDIFEATDLCFPILFPQIEESLKCFVPRRFPGYEKVYRAEQVFSREGNAIIDKFCQETDQKSKERGNRKRTEITSVLLFTGQNIPEHFERYLEFFVEFQISLPIYSTITRGTPNDVLRKINVPPNPGWNSLC